MAILCDKNTKLLVQGMGRMGTVPRQPLEGVRDPGGGRHRAGQGRQEIEGIARSSIP